MLVSQKWQMESQHSPKNITNIPLPSQQTQKVLEDLRISCCSPNKTVQLEALKCWSIWINNQDPDDWKVNSVCFTAVRPLISKKLQPLYKDVDICKMKLRLMWALLVKVQNLMHLEGPQYILEVFLQSCLTWLFSINEDEHEKEISVLIFQLLLGVFKKNEILSGCDKELFPPLSTDILLSNKVFHYLADKFLNIFIHWKKIQDRNIVLRLWKHFLEYCELSCDHIPMPVWHKIFKLADQICSEKNESIKERLSFLHSCATTLKSALKSSKFIDFGNLLTTPCEVLFKKLMELCTIESNESNESNEYCELEMFMQSKEICQVLSCRSVAVGGFDLCINVLNVLEEFYLTSLFWGVWCGLVYCYKVQLLNIDKNHFTKIQKTFYRKLRGVAVNFELDRDTLHKDCVIEVKKHIEILNISCFCTLRSKVEDCLKKVDSLDVVTVATKNQSLDIPFLAHPFSEKIPQKSFSISGKFLTISLFNKSKFHGKTITLSFDLIRNIFRKSSVNFAQLPLNSLYLSRLISLPHTYSESLSPSHKLPFILKAGAEKKSLRNLILPCIKGKPLPLVCSPVKKNSDADDDKVISVPKTRSRKKLEEEGRKPEMENQRRKKRKSFEIIVQEIVKKNKERKTNKNSRRRSPISLRTRLKKKLTEEKPEKKLEKKEKRNVSNKDKKFVQISERKLRNFTKEERRSQKKKDEKSVRTDGKLENYFKVLSKKSGSDVKKVEKRLMKKKKTKRKTGESSCCKSEKENREKKGEIAWRQTSLKTMMNEKGKAKNVKQGFRNRSKAIKVTDENLKIKRNNKKMTGVDSPLPKLCPFKDIFHDHEYAKKKPKKFETFKELSPTKTENTNGENELRKYDKSKKEFSDLKKVKIEETKAENEKTNIYKPQTVDLKDLGKSTPEIQTEKITSKSLSCQEDQREVKEVSSKISFLREIVNDEGKDLNVAESETTLVHNPSDFQSACDDISLLETPEIFKEIVSTPTRKTRKRVKTFDSEMPRKKIKLSDEEKLPLEITEKENLEEYETELNCLSKKEKNVGPLTKDESANGMISSRALRMIALVPESTKSSQMQRESPIRFESLKCKKAPNVDKNSRASKMLALLSENLEVEVNELKPEDIDSNKSLVTTPNTKASISSLKSPNSVKKRRSIRFDDAKNETVLYQTDTPPSQILEEKEKCRRIKTNEVIIILP